MVVGGLGTEPTVLRTAPRFGINDSTEPDGVAQKAIANPVGDTHKINNIALISVKKFDCFGECYRLTVQHFIAHVANVGFHIFSPETETRPPQLVSSSS